jgi:hypothetical protein
MASLNRVELIGYLSAHPETRHLPFLYRERATGSSHTNQSDGSTLGHADQDDSNEHPL